MMEKGKGENDGREDACKEKVTKKKETARYIEGRKECMRRKGEGNNKTVENTDGKGM